MSHSIANETQLRKIAKRTLSQPERKVTPEIGSVHLPLRTDLYADEIGPIFPYPMNYDVIDPSHAGESPIVRDKRRSRERSSMRSRGKRFEVVPP